MHVKHSSIFHYTCDLNFSKIIIVNRFHFHQVTKPAIFSTTFSLIASDVVTKWRQMFYFLISAIMTCAKSQHRLEANGCRVILKMSE